jgi:hypothetical protein
MTAAFHEDLRTFPFFTSITVVALVIKVEDVPMAGCLCYRGYQGYHYGSLL